MKIKSALIGLLSTIALGAMLFLCGCSEVVAISGIRMKDGSVIETTLGDFSYEGKTVVVEYVGGEESEVELTEDMIPEVERFKFFKMGEHEVKVVYNGMYVTTMKINVSRRSFGDIYQLEGYSCVYDGQPHRVLLNHDLPEGATIDYPYGNTFTNAGTYNIVGVINKEGYASKTLSAQLVIEKADYDVSELTFIGGSFVYDGSVKRLEAQNVPEGVTAEYSVYSGNIRVSNAVNVGSYRVVARFDNHDPNYNGIPNREASLEIEKADYDMSGVVFDGVTKTYDGQNYLPSLSGSALPTGVTASFACLDSDGNDVITNANAGEYTMVASFSGNSLNYNPIPSMRAKLVVQKRVIELGDNVMFDDMTVDFDRNQHSLSVVGDLPSGVAVEYENNDHTTAGEYEVVAHFVAKNPNESVDVQSLTSYLIINPVQEDIDIDGHEVTESDLWYDKNTYTMTIPGLDASTYGIGTLAFYTDNEEETKVVWGDPEHALVDGENYRYAIDFYYAKEGFEDSILLPTASGIYTHKEARFESETFVFDGSAKQIEAQNVSDYYDVDYEYYSGEQKVESATNAGVYRAVAVFRTVGSNRALAEMSTTLTIEKASFDMSATVLEDGEFTYDGTAHVIEVRNVPTGVTVEYEYTKSGVTSTTGAVNAGEYDVTARFVVDETNYYPVDVVKEARVTVNKATIVVDFPNGSMLYNADDPVTYYPEFGESDYIPYGVTCNITATRNGVPVEYCREPGEYKVTYEFDIDLENVNPFYDRVVYFRIYNIVLSGVVTFEGYSQTYTKTYINKDDQHTVTARNVPDGVKVRYEYRQNGKTIGKAYWSKSQGVYETEGTPWATHVGVYKVQAFYEPEDPEDCIDLVGSNTVTLEITPAQQYVRHYEAGSSNGTGIGAAQFYYDPETKTVEMVRGLLNFSKNYYPVKELKVWYKPTQTSDPVYLSFGEGGNGFDNDEGYTYNFEVTYYYVPDDPIGVNDISPVPSTGTFTYSQINKKKVIHADAVMTFENENVTFDGQIHTLEVQFVLDGVTVTYEYINSDGQVVGTTGVSAVGTYTVAAYFSATDDAGYVVDVQRKRATLTITEE